MMNQHLNLTCSIQNVKYKSRLPLEQSLLIKSVNLFEIVCPNNSERKKSTGEISHKCTFYFLIAEISQSKMILHKNSKGTKCILR